MLMCSAAAPPVLARRSRAQATRARVRARAFYRGWATAMGPPGLGHGRVAAGGEGGTDCAPGGDLPKSPQPPQHGGQLLCNLNAELAIPAPEMPTTECDTDEETVAIVGQDGVRSRLKGATEENESAEYAGVQATWEKTAATTAASESARHASEQVTGEKMEATAKAAAYERAKHVGELATGVASVKTAANECAHAGGLTIGGTTSGCDAPESLLDSLCSEYWLQSALGAPDPIESLLDTLRSEYWLQSAICEPDPIDKLPPAQPDEESEKEFTQADFDELLRLHRTCRDDDLDRISPLFRDRL